MPRRYRIPGVSPLAGASPAQALALGVAPYLQPVRRDQGRPIEQALNMMMRERMAEAQTQRFMMGIQATMSRQQMSLQQQQQIKAFQESQDRIQKSNKVVTNYKNYRSDIVNKVNVLRRTLDHQSPTDFLGFLYIIPKIKDWKKVTSTGKEGMLLPGFSGDDLTVIQSITPKDIDIMEDFYKHTMTSEMQIYPYSTIPQMHQQFNQLSPPLKDIQSQSDSNLQMYGNMTSSQSDTYIVDFLGRMLKPRKGR